MKILARRTSKTLATCAAAALLGACGTGPFDSDSASSKVRFSFAGSVGGGGLSICDEADFAELRVTPRGESARNQGAGVSNCVAEFVVTVPKGRVNLAGTALGNERPLSRGATSFTAQKDGFRVVLDLSPIDALDVRTRTIGLGGPTGYTFTVDGGGPVRIGKDSAVTLPSLAAGGRVVELDPRPCAVVGNASPTVTIPVEEAQRGDVEFEIDCILGGGAVVIETRTTGNGGPLQFTVSVNEDSRPIGRNNTETFSGVVPGPLDVTLDTGVCAVTRSTPEAPYFLATAGSLRIVFEVACPITERASSIEVRTDWTGHLGSQPLATPQFDAIVTDGAGNVSTQVIGARGAVVFGPLFASRNDYTVELVPREARCVVEGTSLFTRTLTPGVRTLVSFVVNC